MTRGRSGWPSLGSIISRIFRRSRAADALFSLGDRPMVPPVDQSGQGGGQGHGQSGGGQGQGQGQGKGQGQGQGQGKGRGQGGKKAPPMPTKPISPTELFAPDGPKTPIVKDYDVNLHWAEQTFHKDKNTDVVIREFEIGTRPATRAFLVYFDGLVIKDVIWEGVLQPLMILTEIDEVDRRKNLFDVIGRRLLPSDKYEKGTDYETTIDHVLTGETALFVEGEAAALLLETKGWQHRSVERAQSEMVVRGPMEGFTEALRTNTALVRRRLKSPDLVVEGLKVGRLSRSDVALMYIKGLTNEKLVDEVRRRIQAIDVDHVPESGILEQYIEDFPYSLFPQVTATERPDRVSAFLSEGYVAVLIGENPWAIIAPMTFTAFFHSPEDYHLRWPYANFLRALRFMAILTTLFTPAAYIAVTTFHQEMLPTDLMMAIAASRQGVPFPVFLEVLLMDVAFELIREAGVRIPNVIGPTIGIVGAIVLGQAAVAANIVSPILVIIIAVSALASFVIPNFSASFAVRILRFPFEALAAFLGFYGMAAGMLIVGLHLASLRSFGVPYLSPVAPHRAPSVDIVMRGQMWKMWHRPPFLRQRDKTRQDLIVRKWDPVARSTARNAPGQGGKQ
ncbi:MAG: spore germination protein [Bacillota bacterium]